MDRLSKKSDGASTRSGGGRENDDDVEIRPVRRRDAVEAGLDYWIDEGDLVREKERKIALKNRKVRVLQKLFLLLLENSWHLILILAVNGGSHLERKIEKGGRGTIHAKLDRNILGLYCHPVGDRDEISRIAANTSDTHPRFMMKCVANVQV